MSATAHTPSVPGLASFGQYSPISEAPSLGLVAVAGQFGVDDIGDLAGDGSVAAQIRGSFDNVGRVLGEAGLDFSSVLKFTTYVVGRENLASFMEVRKEVFESIFPTGVYPPNTLLLVDGLVEERFVVEIEALAVR